MEEKDIRMAVNDKLVFASALIKTVDMAVGNTEYFGQDGQSVSVVLDIASKEIGECREMLLALDKNAENG